MRNYILGAFILMFTFSILFLLVEINASSTCDSNNYFCGNFSETNVIFNGNWSNGSTLYSNYYSIINSTLYGRDVYPIKENCTSILVCSKYDYTYSRICLRNYSDICKKYAYHYEKQCTRNDSSGRCRSYKRVKINDGCIANRTDLFRTYKTTKVKGDCIANKTETLCRTNFTIGCLDPDTGIYTNQLSLKNFMMSSDNLTWEDIPYGINQKWINNSNLTFKVHIPSVCSPVYDINNAIFIIHPTKNN